MASESLPERYLSLLTLRGMRRYISRSHAVMMSVFIGLVYILIALSESGMLVLARLRGGYTTLLVTSPGTGPGVLIIAPWGVLALPLFGVFAMVLVAIGVALGMSVAVLLTVAVVRRRRPSATGPAAVGSLAGLTPAMITLLALGACCSTTAAATAGVGVIAQISGTTEANLLQNNWYLSIFQIAVVWVALVAQEALLDVYGSLFGAPGAADAHAAPARAPRIDRRVVAGTLVRGLLLVAGVTWSLAMFADWTTIDPSRASFALWVDWILLHQFLSGLAVSLALFPGSFARLGVRLEGSSVGWVGRAVAAAAGFALVVGAPPPLAGWGIEGLGNEILSLAGAPASWGAVAPVFAPGLSLAFRWGVQYLLLGALALAFGLRPRAAIRPALWSLGSAVSPAGSIPADSDGGRPVVG